ncbi:hypothetical protein F2P81_006595 [Scophthalmus maximus]|uniref:Uncharacterized protein n=1 Tax=Scophthalmus maximus TaxID=52904 RepID=A0A6A4T3H3_SCOMX|nr:hypothetical protein F2P81_006595 [Scophthalmus maximus]
MPRHSLGSNRLFETRDSSRFRVVSLTADVCNDTRTQRWDLIVILYIHGAGCGPERITCAPVGTARSSGNSALQWEQRAPERTARSRENSALQWEQCAPVSSLWSAVRHGQSCRCRGARTVCDLIIRGSFYTEKNNN